jgi:hypothetical protein
MQKEEAQIKARVKRRAGEQRRIRSWPQDLLVALPGSDCRTVRVTTTLMYLSPNRLRAPVPLCTIGARLVAAAAHSVDPRSHFHVQIILQEQRD